MITPMRTICIVGFGLLIGSVGCSKDAGGAGTSGGKTSLTSAQLDDAYKLADPDKIDNSVKAVTAKLGAPQKTEGDTSIWYGVGKDGTSCSQLKIGKTKGIESGSTDKANCGLK
jgi:hypothetical protein